MTSKIEDVAAKVGVTPEQVAEILRFEEDRTYCLHCGHLIVPSAEGGWRHSTQHRASLCGFYATPDPCAYGCDPENVRPIGGLDDRCDVCGRVGPVDEGPEDGEL